MPGPPADLSGMVLMGRYRLVELVARGGMGAVYLAEQLLLHGRFAVKVLSPRYAHEAEFVARFLQEARAASQVGHPNIVQIVDFGRDGDLVFMVMEYLAGRDLGSLLHDEGPLPWPRLAPIALQICSALGAAHAAGLVHRDIKPGNCVCTALAGGAELVKVVDFGIAKALEGASFIDHQGERPRTNTGVWMGTLDYMAPEVFRGAPPDPRLDVYALGVLIYRMLTGELPFRSVRPDLILVQDRSDPPRPSSHPSAQGVTPDVDALVRRALAADPERRFTGMGPLAAAIEASLRAAPEEPTTEIRPPAERSLTSPAPRGAEVSTGATTPHGAPSIRRRIVAVAALASVVAIASLYTGEPPTPGSDRTEPTVSVRPSTRADASVKDPAVAARPPIALTPEVSRPSAPTAPLTQGHDETSQPPEESASLTPTPEPLVATPNERTLAAAIKRRVRGCESIEVQYVLRFNGAGKNTLCEPFESKGYEQCVTAAICKKVQAEPSRRGGSFRCSITIKASTVGASCELRP